jgi:NADPH:quinone reductase-like Zn-dependent oxidoreductase
MKAIVCTKYGGPEVLQLKEVEKPVPANNEICIKIKATSITGSDIIIRGCKVPGFMGFIMKLVIGFKRPRNPILGLIVAGEIESIGKSVTKFKKCDEVFGVTIKSPMQPMMGTYAEYKCLSEDSFVVSKPKDKSFEECAAIPYGGGIALHFVEKAKIQPEKKVLVYGASGSIGTSLVQLAKYRGAHVTGICSTSNLELVKSLGADVVIDYTKEDFTSRGEIYDIIFDAVPGGIMNRKDLKFKCKKHLKPYGTYVSIDDERPVFSIEKMNIIKELFATGKFKPVIDRCYPLEKIAEAHAYVEQGHKKGNVVISIK